MWGLWGMTGSWDMGFWRFVCFRYVWRFGCWVLEVWPHAVDTGISWTPVYLWRVLAVASLYLYGIFPVAFYPGA